MAKEGKKSSHRIPRGLIIIGSLKLVSATLLAMAGLEILHLLTLDVSMTLLHFVEQLHLDPQKHAINTVLSSISGLSRGQLRAIGAGTFFYSLLYYVEGIGLLMGYHWAEYLVILATGSLLPFEIYEIVEKLSPVRIGILLINIAILTYLVRLLLRERRKRAAEAAKTSA